MATHTLLHRALHTPRRTWARRAAFQLHLWSGLLLGLYTAVIGLTGSALVFRDEIERALRPTLYTLNQNQQPKPKPTLDQLLTTATTALPTWQPLGFEQLSGNEPTLLYMVARPGTTHLAPPLPHPRPAPRLPRPPHRPPPRRALPLRRPRSASPPTSTTTSSPATPATPSTASPPSPSSPSHSPAGSSGGPASAASPPPSDSAPLATGAASTTTSTP